MLFWNGVLFEEKGSYGNQVRKHLIRPFTANVFHMAKALHPIVDEHSFSIKANEAKQRAALIAQIIQFKVTSQKPS